MKSLLSKQIDRPGLLDEDYILVNKFNEDAVKNFYNSFNKLNADDKIKVIPIMINSYGGSVYELLAMLDIIATAVKPVATIAVGKAMSCGAVLLSAGTPGYRFAAPSTDIMVHQVSTVAMGKNDEIQLEANVTKRLNKSLMHTLARNSGKKDLNFFIKMIKQKQNLDLYLSANECKSIGLVDHVGLPLLDIR